MLFSLIVIILFIFSKRFLSYILLINNDSCIIYLKFFPSKFKLLIENASEHNSAVTIQ